MTYIDLMETIAGMISKLWPKRMLYRDFCPTDFQRPSGFLYVTNAGFNDINIGLVKWNFEAELTLYAETDSYTVESTEALRMDQLAVLNAFADPNIQVGNRSIMLKTSAEAPGPGEAYVKFTAQWTDQRPGFVDEDTAPESESGVPLIFQSTLPVRGATANLSKMLRGILDRFSNF